jgi:hypothetical protein
MIMIGTFDSGARLRLAYRAGCTGGTPRGAGLAARRTTLAPRCARGAGQDHDVGHIHGGLAHKYPGTPQLLRAAMPRAYPPRVVTLDWLAGGLSALRRAPAGRQARWCPIR